MSEELGSQSSRIREIGDEPFVVDGARLASPVSARSAAPARRSDRRCYRPYSRTRPLAHVQRRHDKQRRHPAASIARCVRSMELTHARESHHMTHSGLRMQWLVIWQCQRVVLVEHDASKAECAQRRKVQCPDACTEASARLRSLEAGGLLCTPSRTDTSNVRHEQRPRASRQQRADDAAYASRVPALNHAAISGRSRRA